jgi:hypothetical protein
MTQSNASRVPWVVNSDAVYVEMACTTTAYTYGKQAYFHTRTQSRN